MKILFLGTSAGWPLPRLGCDCSICRSQDPHGKRLRPSVLVNDSILIDASPDIYHQLTNLKVDTSKISALLITHAHPDHIHGFYDLTHLYNRQIKKPKLIVPLDVLRGLRQFHPLPLKPFQPEIVKPKTFIEYEKTKIHQSIKEGIILAKELRPKLCYFTHIGHITGTHQELEAFVQEQGGKNYHIAYDGLELEI